MKLVRGPHAKTLGLGPLTLRNLFEMVDGMGGDPSHLVLTMIRAANGDQNAKARLEAWERLAHHLPTPPPSSKRIAPSSYRSAIDALHEADGSGDRAPLLRWLHNNLADVGASAR